MKFASMFALISLAALCASAQNTATPAFPSVQQTIQVTATPKVAAVYQVGETAVVQFRARVGDATTGNFLSLPVVISTANLEGKDVTEQTTKCQLNTGVCAIKSDKPQVLLITAWQNGVFGLQQVVLNFVNMTYNLPAAIDVTASMAQSQEGTSVSLFATSSVNVEGPVRVTATTMYTNASDWADRSIYFPNGISYGQRIEVNVDFIYPLSFRDRRNFRVQFYDKNNSLVAEGYGSSVGSTEWNGIVAGIDDNNDLAFTLNAPYSPSTDYTVVLLRGDRFRVELSQYRNEIFVYSQGDKTKIIFNRGSLGENTYFLPGGFYTVNVVRFDKSVSEYYNQSLANGLSLNGQYQLK